VDFRDDTPASHTEFWYRLSRRPVTSNDEALHGLLLYLDKGDPAADYPQRVKLLQARGLLADNFGRPANQAVTRGDLAVALTKILGLKGGLTSRLFGASPRYAVRTLESSGIYPQSSPEQTFSGAEFCGIIGRVHDIQDGDPTRAPALYLPSEVTAMLKRETPRGPQERPAIAHDPCDAKAPSAAAGALQAILVMLLSNPGMVSFLAADPTIQPATRIAEPPRAIVTGVDGSGAQVRFKGKENWENAVVGMLLYENTLIRTGPRDAVTFSVGSDRAFCVDRMTTVKIAEIQGDGKQLVTVVELEQGRVRHDLEPQPATPLPTTGPVVGSGPRTRSTIRSPNATLMVRGTQVSLFDQPPYTPEATSLTGRALFENTHRQLVAFGGTARASISGDHTSAAQDAEAQTKLTQSPEIAINDFQVREIGLLLRRGGFVVGDVAVGNLHVSQSELMDLLPGRLNFVLTWTGGPKRQLADLNLIVVSPKGIGDAVGNPPFVYCLNPSDPISIKQRDSVPYFHQTSPSGGSIGLNSVGPEGLEIASWSGKFPTGQYVVVATNQFPANLFQGTQNLPGRGSNPIRFEIRVFLDGGQIYETTGSVGLYESSGRVTPYISNQPLRAKTGR
jgi:hypothetical protein